MIEQSGLCRVLLVVHEETSRKTMNAALKQQGFHVVATGSVTEALRRIATENYHILITHMRIQNTEILTNAFHGRRTCQVVVSHQFGPPTMDPGFRPGETVRASDGVFSRRTRTGLPVNFGTHAVRHESGVIGSAVAFLNRGFLRGLWKSAAGPLPVPVVARVIPFRTPTK